MEAPCLESTLHLPLLLSCSLTRTLFWVGWLFSRSVLWTWTLCAYCLSSGPVPSSKPTGLQFAEELPLGRFADSLLPKKLPAEHPWPSRLGHGLTTMNHFQCFMVFFLAFLRVGGSEPQPLIYKVIWDKNRAKKEKGALLTLWGLHCRARGNSPLALYGDVWEAHLDSRKHSTESGDRGSNLGLSLLLWDLWQA